MKLTMIILFSTTLLASASLYSQTTRLTLNFSDISYGELFSKIEEQSEFSFAYTGSNFDPNQKIKIDVTKGTLTEILNEVLPGNVTYEIINRYVVIRNADGPNSKLTQQAKTISGKVSDSTGAPLPGVTVVVKGTTQGTITDGDGNYTLPNIQADAIVVFSFVGMKSQEIAVAGKTSISIVMAEETIGLEEVVAVGFGTQKKVNLTGSVSTVDAESLETRPVKNITEALQGIVPGLNITQNGGGDLSLEPGLNIRGRTTIGTGSTGNPLVLIDGMEGDINTINPNDVENISVLKDAAASSIYGSRAPFGVILITTKRGKAGKTIVNYSNNFRWNSPILLPNSMDSYTFALYYNDASINRGRAAVFSDTQLQRIKDYQDGKITTTNVPSPSNPNVWGIDFEPNANVDWYDIVYKEGAPSMEHSFNVSGGSENITYYLSGNYLYQSGLMELTYDDYHRYNVSANINAKITKWASINYSSKWARTDIDEPSWMRKAYNLNQDFGRRGWPTVPVYDPNGHMFQNGKWDFFVGLVSGGRSKEQEDWTNHQFQLTIEPTKGWKIISELNYKVSDYFNNWDLQLLYNYDVHNQPYLNTTDSRVEESVGRSNFLNSNFYTEYLKTIDKHSFKVLLGFQSELNKSRNVVARRDGIIVPELPVLNLTSGTALNGNPITPTIQGWYDQWATVGYFGRLNYDYDGRYLAEVNLRYDGTSRFRSDKRWNLYPSVSIGWNLARESFWENLENHISNFKIRGSYGVLGNQNTSSLYPTYATMPVGISNGTWLVGGTKPNTASIPALISSSLTWENIKSYNIGADLSALKNRLTVSYDYFIRFTNDMVGPAPELPATLGQSVPRTNNTDLKTYGFELDIAWQDRLKNDLGYNIHFILSDSQTKILKYPNKTNSLSTYQEGQKMGEIWGYETIGIAKTQEEMDAHLASLPEGGQNALGSDWKAGDIMYKDLNNDGKIDNGANTKDNHGDLTIIGNDSPRYAFGFDLSADWKGFDLRAFFQGVMKKDVFQNNRYFWGAHTTVWESAGFVEHEDYFRDDPNHPLGLNLDSYYPRPIFDDRKDHQVQSKYLLNASYIRLKNLQLGYTLPQKMTSKVSISKVRVYVSGENIWTKTKMATMYDPETADGGWGGNVYPLSKVYSCGVMITL